MIDFRVEHLYWFLSVLFSHGIISDHSPPSTYFNHTPSLSLIQTLFGMHGLSMTMIAAPHYAGKPMIAAQNPSASAFQSLGPNELLRAPTNTFVENPTSSRCTSACVRSGHGMPRLQGSMSQKLHTVAMTDDKVSLSLCRRPCRRWHYNGQGGPLKTNQYKPRYPTY